MNTAKIQLKRSSTFEEIRNRKIYGQHRKRVRRASRAIDNSPPPVLPHLELKLKKLKIEKDRLDLIRQENKRLLAKLLAVNDTTNKNSSHRIAIADYESNRISTNQERRKNAIRVVQQNEEFVDRLLKIQPTYHRERMERDWERNKAISDRLSKYCNRTSKGDQAAHVNYKTCATDLDIEGFRDDAPKYVNHIRKQIGFRASTPRRFSSFC